MGECQSSGTCCSASFLFSSSIFFILALAGLNTPLVCWPHAAHRVVFRGSVLVPVPKDTSKDKASSSRLFTVYFSASLICSSRSLSEFLAPWPVLLPFFNALTYTSTHTHTHTPHLRPGWPLVGP